MFKGARAFSLADCFWEESHIISETAQLLSLTPLAKLLLENAYCLGLLLCCVL